MRVLAVGDVVGRNGVSFFQSVIPAYKRVSGVDFCIVNGENAHDANGITPEVCDMLLKYGADVVTTGNHAFHRREMYGYYDSNRSVLRPANFPDSAPGHGVYIADKGAYKIGVINLMGTTFMEPLANPFLTMDELLEDLRSCRVIFVDFHAEATSEKRAMGFYLDGKVSAVYGTHTHTQTADDQILPNGTAYITDIGMCGPIHSVLGVKPEIIIRKFKTNMPERFDFAEGECMLNGCLFDIDQKTGKATAIERVDLR